ncbi:hypothetical protein OS493_011989 [Desmophyllum pertusum]|uniref:C2H2-type domain-containing protein n=1 Tax=Desmophyllum pertusum TaxID=174260 RepID=A0A9X0A2N4_9CNID|nr:hypothetical protein OS493_011989 [Desmophyllum pertusum]
MEKKIKAIKVRAVDQFSTKFNAQQHDEAKQKDPPPHPNKLPFTHPLSVVEYLATWRKNAGDDQDLTLRRFSPTSYTEPLVLPVSCCRSGCNFAAVSGHAMMDHQKTLQHPGWGRSSQDEEGKLWICSLSSCLKSFKSWDAVYKHMQSHSKPLSCTFCSF